MDVILNPRDLVLREQTVVCSQQVIFWYAREVRIFTLAKAVGIGSDDTLFAKVDGRVRFERVGRDRKKVSVYAEQ